MWLFFISGEMGKVVGISPKLQSLALSPRRSELSRLTQAQDMLNQILRDRQEVRGDQVYPLLPCRESSLQHPFEAHWPTPCHYPYALRIPCLSFPNGLLTPPPSAQGELGDVPVGVDGFGEERLVPISAGLGCDPLVWIVRGAQVGYRVAATTL